MKVKVLVTGGTGYIGSHTVVALIEAGYEVIIVDDLSNSSIDVLQGIEAIAGMKPVFHNFDICEKDKVLSLFSQHPDISAIIHFAASKAVNESVENPQLYYRNNLIGLLNLIDAMQTTKAKSMVFSSSCTVYGQPETLPVTENSPFQPASSPYGNTKQICEEILRDNACAGKDLNCIALRYFNPVGAHSSGLIGELPIGIPNNLVPFITRTAAGLSETLKIFGDDYNTPDGTAVRDYIHVVDLAKAHLKALERILDKGSRRTSYEYFNIGTGKGYSVLEVVRAFEKISGKKLKFEITKRRPGDIEKIYADTTLANTALKWNADKDIEDMMRDAWRWQRAYSQRATSK